MTLCQIFPGLPLLISTGWDACCVLYQTYWHPYKIKNKVFKKFLMGRTKKITFLFLKQKSFFGVIATPLKPCAVLTYKQFHWRIRVIINSPKYWQEPTTQKIRKYVFKYLVWNEGWHSSLKKTGHSLLLPKKKVWNQICNHNEMTNVKNQLITMNCDEYYLITKHLKFI